MNDPHSLVPVGSGSVSLQMVSDENLPKSYAEARDMIDRMMQDGRKVMLLHSWNVGRIIAHIQEDAGGRYGAKAVDRVAADLEMSSTRILHEYLRFYNAHRDINYVQKLKLEWSAARELLRISDDKKRTKMEAEAQKKEMSVREVRDWVKEENNKDAAKKPKDKGKKSEPRKIKAITYYRKLVRKLEDDLEEIKGMAQRHPEMALLVSNEDRTTDEDYEIIVNGKAGGEQPLVEQVGDLAERLSNYLRTTVVPIRNAFED